MSKPRSHRRPPHREATRKRPSTRARFRTAGDSEAEQDLLFGLRESMRAHGGADLLPTVGMMMEALPGGFGSAPQAEIASPAPTFADFVETLLGVNIAETTAVLRVVRAFTDDDVLKGRINRELSGRTQPMPPVVAGLEDIRAADAWLLSDALRDVDSLVVGIDGPPGTPRSCVVQVHHDLAAITDAFLTDDTPDQVRQRFADMFEREDVDGVIVALSPADARAHIERLLELGASVPTSDTGTWPGCRPFLWYLCRGLPEGGQGYRIDDLDDDELDAAVDHLLASEAAQRTGVDGRPGSPDRVVLENMVVFAATAGLVEPWRWSPRRVSEFLIEWLPDAELADLRRPERVLAVLRVVVGEAGRHTGLPARQITTTLGAIDMVAADFRRIAAQRTSAVEDVDLVGDEYDEEDADADWLPIAPRSRGELLGPRVADLAAMVGGQEALAAIDTGRIEPLRLEPLELERFPEAVRALTGEVDDLAAGAIDALADERLRGEYRAAVRALLTRVAQAAPASVRRGKPAVTAAALCWAVGRVNDLVGERREHDLWRVVVAIGQEIPPDAFQPSPIPVKALLRHFGVSVPPSTSAARLLGAAGYRPTWLAGEGYALGEPGLLTSNKRLRIAIERDLWAHEPAWRGR